MNTIELGHTGYTYIDTVYAFFQLFKGRKELGHETASCDSRKALTVGWKDLATGDCFGVGLLSTLKGDMVDPNWLRSHMSPEGVLIDCPSLFMQCMDTQKVLAQAEKSYNSDWAALGLTFNSVRKVLRDNESRVEYFGARIN